MSFFTRVPEPPPGNDGNAGDDGDEGPDVLGGDEDGVTDRAGTAGAGGADRPRTRPREST